MANAWALDENPLDENWDMFLGPDNEIARVVGVDELRQHIKNRIIFFYEEWFLDRDAGLPWFQTIFVKNTKRSIIDGLIKKEIVQTPGVLELLEFQTSFDFKNRVYKVIKFVVRSEYGLLEETL